VIPATDPVGPDLTGPDLAKPNLTGPDLAGLDLADALRAACEAELPRPKVPTEFCLVPELPLGATGKVSRRRLRDMAMA
jgi:acyl-CoA synthetase (AMP-forming)/AMP-acid ligase II